MSNPSLNDKVKQIITNCQIDMGFELWGASAFSKPLSIAFYKSWLEQNLHGEMLYLQEHLDLKEDPGQLSLQRNCYFNNSLVFAFSYQPHPYPKDKLDSIRVAKYAQGMDYHLWLKEKLDRIIHLLRTDFPDANFLSATDSMPILERDLAYRAGLGWFGKNSCIIHPRIGSFFLLGEILTDLDITPSRELSHDFCGNCRKCIDSCPTQAILENKTLDARKCISYLTIESQKIPSPELREKISDWFFGCDICQDVCPWNIKTSKAHHRAKPPPPPEQIEEDLKFILESSGKKLMREFTDSPLSRARPFGLKRNAIIVITNLRLRNLIPQIEAQMENPKLFELCRWSLNILNS